MTITVLAGHDSFKKNNNNNNNAERTSSFLETSIGLLCPHPRFDSSLASAAAGPWSLATERFARSK